ncbi:hypothetical protein PCANC_05417 [Puccinia coronata f. sp. avenae]|uniref:Uncharacterized protein n=1 Tax=Puccinia coronata f. sp. avenae TaxID=200324 RepID=A0A2N5T6V3_9BASI|nr:hypothetical protein PCANC_05417 [Puccinia coronata f. sp. avenae]PLW46276.1 hypothetical protein PCASD_03774 [Puccinia coronata f. sp. avenae]
MLGRKIPTSIKTSYNALLDEEFQESRRLLNDGHSRPGPGSPWQSSLLRPTHMNRSAAQLSPLFQCAPMADGVDYSRDAYEKSYDDVILDDVKLEAGAPSRHNTGGPPFDEELDEWTDPGRGIGRMALVCCIIAALGLLGLSMFVGKAIDVMNAPENASGIWKHRANHSAQAVLTTFPFSPSHFLQDCPSQSQNDELESSTSTSASMDASALHLTPTHNTYFQGTFQNKTVYSETDHSGKSVCEKSLTYLLDDDFGLTFHLNAISLAAALAEKDSRAFFVVDSEWDRGTWSDHFLTIPDPGCAPPPPSEMAGCPRSTRHWILTSSIFASHFSKDFQLNFGDNQTPDRVSSGTPSGIIPYSRRSIYDMARSTFMRFFVLAETNDDLIRKTKKEIVQAAIWGPSSNGKLPPFISVHIRKGDRHPHDPLHKFDYVPINQYIDSINSTWTRLRDADATLPESPNVYLASDTPLALEQLRALTPASWKFFHLSEASSPEISQIAHPHEYSQLHFHAHILSERVGYTRGQIIDMAFLGGGWPKPDGSVALSSTDSDVPLATICTVSSNMCQFAALQLGWSEAFEKSKWINLDLPLSAGWLGVEIPAPNTGDANPDGHGHGAGAHHHSQ